MGGKDRKELSRECRVDRSGKSFWGIEIAWLFIVKVEFQQKFGRIAFLASMLPRAPCLD